MSMFIIFFPIFFSLVESILTNALLVPILEKATKVRIFHRVHIYLKFLEKSLLCYVFCYIHIYRTVRVVVRCGINSRKVPNCFHFQRRSYHPYRFYFLLLLPCPLNQTGKRFISIAWIILYSMICTYVLLTLYLYVCMYKACARVAIFRFEHGRKRRIYINSNLIFDIF